MKTQYGHKMLKTLKTTLKRERGFTLIELLAVMAIVATLAGIVSVQASGTGVSSKEAAAKQDATGVQISADDYFTDQTGRLVDTTSTVSIAVGINGQVPSTVTQVIGNRWPETFITETLAAGESGTTPYATEFPTESSSAINDLIIVDLDGFAISGSELLTGYTAIDFVKLVGDPEDSADFTGGYSVKPPVTSLQTQTAEGTTFKNYLWLFRKTTSAGGNGPNDARVVALFKLTRIVALGASGNNKVDLIYVQIQ